MYFAFTFWFSLVVVRTHLVVTLYVNWLFVLFTNEYILKTIHFFNLRCDNNVLIFNDDNTGFLMNFLVSYLFLDYLTLLSSYKGLIAFSETDMATGDEWVKSWKTVMACRKVLLLYLCWKPEKIQGKFQSWYLWHVRNSNQVPIDTVRYITGDTVRYITDDTVRYITESPTSFYGLFVKQPICL